MFVYVSCTLLNYSCGTDFVTSPEHTLVGIHVAFAFGVHRYFGWRGVAIAGLASNIPDWDGLPMIFDMQRYESGHRVWGHNVMSIVLTSLVLGMTQRRFDWIGRVGRRVVARLPEATDGRRETEVTHGNITMSICVGISLFAQIIHLPCDMVVSGGKGLSDWAIQPWWPFSNTAAVYPLIPWGDIGPTVILMGGIIAIAKWRSHTSTFASLTLVALVGYLLLRGMTRGVLFV